MLSPGKLLGVVEEAGLATLEVYNSSRLDVEYKQDNTPVTPADIASHEILIHGLARVLPDIPVLSEEGDTDSNLSICREDTFVLVDPLDGTKEFIAKTGEFTVCVALVKEGRPVFGIVHAPALGVSFYGGRETGSFRFANEDEDTPAAIRVADKSTGVVMISRSHQNTATSRFIAENYPDHRQEIVGSQLKYTHIAEGRADASPRVESGLSIWDLAAGHAILEGAGGNISRMDGSDIDYRAPDLKITDFIASK